MANTTVPIASHEALNSPIKQNEKRDSRNGFFSFSSVPMRTRKEKEKNTFHSTGDDGNEVLLASRYRLAKFSILGTSSAIRKGFETTSSYKTSVLVST